MDISAIDISPEWAKILADYRSGRVDKASIICELQTDHRVPIEANQLLAGMLEGTIKAVRGNKPDKTIARVLSDMDLARFASEIEWQLRHPESFSDDVINALRGQKGGIKSKVDGFVADTFGFLGVTVARVKASRIVANKLADDLARQHLARSGKKVSRRDVLEQLGMRF